MRQQNNLGMQLRQPRNPRKNDLLWLIQMLVAILTSAALVLILTGLTGNAWHMMLTITAVLCVIWGILRKVKQESWFYLGALCVLLVVILFCRSQVLEGFRIFWNQAGDAMVRGTGWVIPEWEMQMDARQQGLCVFLFVSVSAGLISLLCCMLTVFAPVVLAVFPVVLLLGGMMLFGVDIRFFEWLPVLSVSVVVLLYSGWHKGYCAAAIALNWGVCAITACLLLAFAYVSGMQLWTAQVHDHVHESIHQKKYETQYTTLPEGDFSDYRKSERDAEQALAVTMENPQKMYLRGFTGAIFAEDEWKPLDREALAKNRQLLYWLNLNAFDLNAQFDAAAANAQIQQSTVTIQNIGACSFYRYVPFNISKGAWSQPENLNTDGVYADGERSYVYSVSAATGEDIMQILTQLQTSEDPAVLQYRKAESSYRKFVEHHYLQIPSDVKAVLQEYWDEIAAAYGESGMLIQQQAQECALIFLSRCYPEEGTPEDMELPLQMAEGTPFQYATVAAMALRYFGIPARYAEGYVISEEMAAGVESGETMRVDSSCASAWVEVYQDGIGWIPMDMTPGMGEMLEHQDSKDSGNGVGSSNLDSEEKEEEEQEEPEEMPEATGGTVVQILLKTVATSVLVILLAALLIFLILWIRRRILLGEKEKRFQDGNCSIAVAWIYADTALLLEKLGYDWGNGSMKELQQPLEDRFGPEYAALFECASNLNDRAMFSSRLLEEEHRNLVREFRSQTLQNLNMEVKWYKRIWLKWVLCLY